MRFRMWLAVVLSCCATTLHAGTLSGSVIDVNGTPRALLRVEIHGPTGTSLFTDNDGKFSIDLPAGQYVVQIIQGGRGARFGVTVTDSGTVIKVFKLPW